MGKIENLQEKSGRILEFDKIRKLLAGFTASEPGEELALSLWPSTVPEEVARAQKETTEARELWQTSRIPLDGIFDIRAAAEGARRGKVLSPEELFTGSTLRAARLLQGVLDEKEKAPVLPPWRQVDSPSPVGKGFGPSHWSRRRVRDNQPTLRSLRGKPDASRQHPRAARCLTRSGEAQKYLKKHWSPSGTAGMSSRSNRNSGSFSSIVHDQSASGCAFIEPMAVVELNNKRRVSRDKERNRKDLAELKQVGEAAEGIWRTGNFSPPGSGFCKAVTA